MEEEQNIGLKVEPIKQWLIVPCANVHSSFFFSLLPSIRTSSDQKRAMKLGCFPARPLLILLALVSISQSGIQLHYTGTACQAGLPVAYLLLNAFLIFAVLRKHERTLKWAQRATVLLIVGSSIPILFVPIFTASLIASGKVDNYTEHALGNGTAHSYETADGRFYWGSVCGFVLEIAMIVFVAVEALKYVLVTRFWRAEVDKQLFINTDTFKTP
ncbi:unnamed protein product [Caenorhabditis sp. 36 PRJEB53466]|nr:unnamed protein product [Caenorhabditis sp. 36 PRJEB53466]